MRKHVELLKPVIDTLSGKGRCEYICIRDFVVLVSQNWMIISSTKALCLGFRKGFNIQCGNEFETANFVVTSESLTESKHMHNLWKVLMVNFEFDYKTLFVNGDTQF